MNGKVRCLYCRRNGQDGASHVLSVDHIVPKVLGGFVGVRFVCKACNEGPLGGFEADLKRSPFVVHAITALGLQEKEKAYRNARIEVELDTGERMRGRISNSGEPVILATEMPDGSVITPDCEAIDTLRKLVHRYEKKTGRKCEINLDNYDALPLEVDINTGVGISIKKRRPRAGKVLIGGLNCSIPFQLSAKIAFEHLSWLFYEYSMRSEFDDLRKWVIENNPNRYVLLHTSLDRCFPAEMEYQPYHALRYMYYEGALVAAVTLFSTIKYFVFLGLIEERVPNSILLDFYHIYDIRNRTVFCCGGSEKTEEANKVLLRAIAKHGLYCHKTGTSFLD